jgi:hypothetical protein
LSIYLEDGDGQEDGDRSKAGVIPPNGSSRMSINKKHSDLIGRYLKN